MPINTKYKGYDVEKQKSDKVRDFSAGESQVKSKGERYLPRLTGQTTEQYAAYLNRGALVPAVKPTASAVIGAIMRKPPVIESNLTDIEIDIDGNDQNIELFVSESIKELLLSGGVGQLVDWDDDKKKAIVKTYAKESLINYSHDYIVLSQTYTVRNPQDKYDEVVKVEYLELMIDDDGQYIQNVWRENKGGWGIVETVTPTKRGDSMSEFPFVFTTIEGLGIKLSDPLLLSLANVNHNQYTLSTDQRHGLHWSALPTLFVFGELTDSEGERKKIKVGAGSFNHIEDEKARAELLEFSGAGLGSVKEVIDSDISVMASVGAKMLTSDSSGVKAAETARIDASSETATLSTIANAIDLMMSKIFEMMDEWSGTANSKFTINRDFIDVKLDPQALAAYLQTYLSGGMSLNTFLSLLHKGELLPKGITPEDEANRIDQGGNDFEDNEVQEGDFEDNEAQEDDFNG